MSTRTVSGRSAAAYAQAKRRRLKALGQWQDPYVDAEPVRQHLRKINELGMSFRAIAERVGLPHDSSLQPLLWGRGPYGPSKTVLRETAELILAYWPTMDDLPDTAVVDATGTRRRLEALAVRGWSRNLTADKVGMRRDNFRKAVSQPKVTARVARLVAAAYDAWWNQDPLEHGVSLNSVSRVRGEAARAGYHGALAWDDETIDDPNAVPVTDAVQPTATEGGNLAARWLLGESVVLGDEDRKQVVQHLFEWTQLTKEEIGARVDMTPAAAEQIWNRLKRQARAEGRPVPWRRVYALRDKTLEQGEMGAAA